MKLFDPERGFRLDPITIAAVVSAAAAGGTAIAGAVGHKSSPGPIPNSNSAQAQAAAEAERQRAANAQGQSSTILGGGFGGLGDTQKKTLLGQ